MSDLIETFGEIVRVGTDFPVDFDRAWQWIGYSSKGHAIDALRANFVEGEDFCFRKIGSKTKGSGGHNRLDIMLSTDCFKAFAMMAGTARGKEVRRYFIQAEKMLRSVMVKADAMKIARRSLTDSLQLSGESDRMHGHAYSTYTDLIYRAVLGMDSRHYREAFALDPRANVREHITTAQSESVRKYEELVCSMVDMGIPYEQIKATVQSMSARKIEAAA